jgi:ABC-2 type transport system ATP-binding protein
MRSFYEDLRVVELSDVNNHRWNVETPGRTKRFGERTAVDSVDLHVRTGEVFALHGPTGAGKSTMLRMLCGVLEPSGGRATVVGFDVARDAAVVRMRTGYVNERFSLYEELTVEENLAFYSGVWGVSRHDRRRRVDDAMELHDIVELRRLRTADLATSWRQRVALAAATIHQPALLLLDEPTTGIDPASRRAFWNAIHRLLGCGTSILVTTISVDDAARCHRLAFMLDGHLLDEGCPDDIIARGNLQAAEIEVDDAAESERVLEARPEVVSVEPFGRMLRVVSRDANAIALVGSMVAFRSARPARVTVEDALVSMVRGVRRARAVGGV